MDRADAGGVSTLMGHRVCNLRQQNKGRRKEVRMTTEPESEGQGASEMENASPSEPVSPHLSRHKLQGGPALQTVRCELLLLFMDAGNTDSGHVLRRAPTSLPCREPWSIFLTSLCRGF